MKKKIITLSAVLFCAALVVAAALAIAPGCVQASFLSRTEWILNHHSDAIEAKYGQFDIVEAEPDADGLYKDMTCSYIVQNDNATMNLLSITFDTEGRARSCYFEKVYADNENAPFQIEFDADRTDLPAPADTERIEAGMSVSEVCAILGKPQRDVGSGMLILEWDLSSGEVFCVSFTKNLEDDSWYVSGGSVTTHDDGWLTVTTPETA